MNFTPIAILIVSQVTQEINDFLKNNLLLWPQQTIIHAYMEKFYKRVHIKLIEVERKRSWLLAQTGIKASTWSSWEKYGRIPPADRALAIADALGVSVEYLVAGRETPFDFRGSDPLILQINQQLLGMTEQQLRRVLTVVNTIGIEGARP
jgi:hypothetical protein